MPLSTSAAVPLAEKDDERSASSTSEREISSSDGEIDDEDDEEEGEEELQVSSNRNDASNIVESKGHGGQLDSDLLSASGKPETRIPSKTLYVEESSANFKFCGPPNEPLATQGEDLGTNDEGSNYPISGKQPAKEKAIQEYVINGQDARFILERKAPKDHHEQYANRKSHLAVNEIMYETTNLSSVAAKEFAIDEVISIPVRHHSCIGVSSDQGLEQKSKQMDMQTEGDKWHIKSRSAALQSSAGSLSPDAEFNSENKRPAHICDFFARGWCIKGSSCRFIHIKDGANNPRQQHEEDVAAAEGKIDVQLDEGTKYASGIRNAAERSRSPSPGSADSLPSSVGNKTALSSHLFSERSLPLEHDENQRLHQFHEILKSPLLQSKGISMGPSPGYFQNLPADNYVKPALLCDRGSSTFRNGFLPEHLSSVTGSVASLGNIYKENQTFRVSTRQASLPFGSSLSACPLGTQKMPDNDREHHTSRLSSLLQGSSPFSSSEPKTSAVSDIARDSFHFAECRIKISSDDWEPSVPFRPSFFVTTGTSSPRRQYDPLRDSIDFSNVGERHLKFSFCSQDPSLQNVAYPPTYGNSTSTGLLVPERNADKRTASCHSRYRESLVNNNCYTSGKDSLTTDANDGTSAADMQNGTLAKEEISSVASHVKEVSKANKIDTVHDDRHRRDGSRCKKDLKVDRVREKNENDIEHKADGDALKESKAMRHFHTALVDLIKELLKPTWREGHLSKDAHNTIVKKAVDKVIGTIQPHQIPLTFESVKQYLSSSQPKIARLVQGYIDKYGKS